MERRSGHGRLGEWTVWPYFEKQISTTENNKKAQLEFDLYRHHGLGYILVRDRHYSNNSKKTIVNNFIRYEKKTENNC